MKTTDTPKLEYYKEEDGKIILSPDEKIFDTSWATEPALIRLEHLLLKDNEQVNTILINMNTIIRNSFDKGLPFDNNLKRIGTEVNLIIERINHIYEERKTISHPYLIIYMGDYRKDYEASHLRPLPEGRKFLKEVEDSVFEKFQNTVIKTGVLTCHFVKLNKIPYADELQTVLKSISHIIPKAFYTGYYYLISHQPIDYHLLNKSPNGKLINSHTGVVIERSKLGLKIFGDERVPFNYLLHTLLGDKVQLLPKIKPKDRRQVIEEAQQNSWGIKTEAQIKKDLKNIGLYID